MNCSENSSPFKYVWLARLFCNPRIERNENGEISDTKVISVNYWGVEINKNIFYEKVGGMTTIGGVKSKETRSYQKGKCNSPIFSTETTHALEMC